MRLDTVAREVISSGTIQVAKATIKATPKIFDMFANDTYANKPVAICRELVANGIDAHVAAGTPNRPVEITMPTGLEPVFKVRDFGVGMSHDFVMGPFMAYTDGSTKDKSDDQIGGFGIGSKSPFAYVDQFTLRVVKDGVLSVYTMFKDEDGIPAVGLQGQTTTDEHNGVEVSFPVEEGDHETFRNAAQEALQYFQPLPFVKNGELKAPSYSYVGQNWALRPASGPLFVIMGGVRYPVAKDNLDRALLWDARLRPLLDYGIDLTLPIGAAGVATSREALSYTPKTSASIKAALNGILDDVIRTFATFFDSAPTLWEAMVRLHKESGSDGSTYNQTARQQLMLAHAKWRGQELKTSFSFRKEKGDLGGAWHISRSKRSDNLATAKWQTLQDLGHISPGHVRVILIDDLPMNSSSRIIQRVSAFFEDKNINNTTNLVLRSGGDNADPANIRALLDRLGNPPNVIYTSTLPEPPKQAKVKNVRPRVRMWTFTGGKVSMGWNPRRPDNLTPAYAKRGLVNEIKYVDQPAAGIVVVMRSFDLPENFYKKMDTNLMSFDELHFVNEGDWEKLKNTGWERFEEVFEKRFNAALAKYPELPQRLAIFRDWPLRDFFKFVRNIRRQIRLTPTQQKLPFGRIIGLYDNYYSKLDADQNLLAPLVEGVYPARVDTQKLREQFSEKQPDAELLRHIIDTSEESHINLFLRNL